MEPPSLAIKEANVHLQALHERNQQLESKVIELTAMLQLRDEQQKEIKEYEKFVKSREIEHQKKNKELLNVAKDRDTEILFLKQEIDRLMSDSRANTKKDLIINQLTRKVKILNEILKYKSALDSITVCLEQVEEDFMLDIDNLVNCDGNNNKGNNLQNGDLNDSQNDIDPSKLKDLDQETNL